MQWEWEWVPKLMLMCCSLLLQDLAEYKKFREKEVATAARGLIGAFREMHPGELLMRRCMAGRERGRERERERR